MTKRENKVVVINESIQNVADKISKFQNDGWEVTSTTPLEYWKTQDQDYWYVGRIMVTLKRSED